MRARSLILAAGMLLAMGAKAVESVHFALARSVPAADATVTSPPEIRLWFTEAAADNSVSIRLTNAAGAAVETPALVHDAKEPTAYAIPVEGRLAAGRYTVAWRGVGDDGHAVQGNFAFTVSAE